jgi:opacity protein-like surface antigen
MKKLILAAVLAVAATAQADAAPVIRPAPTQWYQGSWTCTIANFDKQKLFMTLDLRTGRAAVRGYPYYGKVEYTQLRLAGGFRPVVVVFTGRGMSLSLRRSATEGVMTGSARLTYRNLQLTCAKS